jgi:hypothetical protein
VSHQQQLCVWFLLFYLALISLFVVHFLCKKNKMAEQDYGSRLTAIGSSESSAAARNKAVQIFDIFCQERNVGFSFASVDATQFCNTNLIEAFSDYLVKDYKKKKTNTSNDDEKSMMLNGVKNTLSQIMMSAKQKFKDDTSILVKDFFSILGLSQTAPNNWYRDLRKEIERVISRRAIDKGEALSTKASPISWRAVTESSFQYFMVGTADAMLRRAVIGDTMLSAGRGSEAVTQCMELMEWDYTFSCLVTHFSQRKTGKQKPILHINHKYSSKSWNVDFFHLRGCLYMLGKGGQQCGGDEVNWIYPEIAAIGANSKAQRLTLYLTDTKPTLKQSVAYSALNVTCMPSEPSSGGLRSGAIHEMTKFGVTQKANEAVSGHDHRGESASYEYQFIELNDLIMGKSMMNVRIRAMNIK